MATWRQALDAHPLVALVQQGTWLAFYRQLASLLATGLGWPEVLAALSAHREGTALAQALDGVRGALESGQSLRGALQPHAHLLGRRNVALLALAEETGRREQVLGVLVARLEVEAALRGRVLAACAWPATLVAALVLVGPALSLGGQVRSLEDVAAGYQAGLARNLLLLGAGLAVLALGPVALEVWELGGTLERALWRTPVLGPLARGTAAVGLLRGLGVALDAGLGLPAALTLGLQLADSEVLGRRRGALESALRQGRTLAQALSRLEVLPREALSAVEVGERTGTLATALQGEATRLEEATTRRVVVTLGAVGFAVAAALVGLLAWQVLQSALGTLRAVEEAVDAAGR